jgi:hypothetical protein
LFRLTKGGGFCPPPPPPLRTHTHAHTHTRTHACTHTRLHTHTHARAHAHTQTHTRTHAHRHAPARARTRAHTHARTHTHAAHARWRMPFRAHPIGGGWWPTNERLSLDRITGRLSRGGACTPEELTGAAPPISRTTIVITMAITIVIPVIATGAASGRPLRPFSRTITITIATAITLVVPVMRTGAAGALSPPIHGLNPLRPPAARGWVHRRSIGQSAL